MMPKGVEHETNPTTSASFFRVSLPMMPKGVEHLCFLGIIFSPLM